MKKEILKPFGIHLCELRVKKNLTQADLTFKGKFDNDYVDKVERGERNPSLKTLCRLADALGITLTELLNFKFFFMITISVIG